MSKIAAIIFDMDGVIVDSNPTHKVVIQEFCEKYGRQLTDKFLRENVYGRTNQEWIPNVFGDISEDQIEEFAEEKEQTFRKVFNPKEHIVPGLLEFLKTLDKTDIKKVVATSAPAENADFILDELSICHYFDAVLNSSHVSKSKPHPEPYLKAAKAIGVSPDNCIVIEDSISGVKSGVAAGARVVGITTTHTRDELYFCDLVVDDFEELDVAELEKLFS